jgi:hypothetical protein
MDSKSNSRDPLAVPRTNQVFKKEDAFLAKKSSYPWAGFGYQGHVFSPMTLFRTFSTLLVYLWLRHEGMIVEKVEQVIMEWKKEHWTQPHKLSLRFEDSFKS